MYLIPSWRFTQHCHKPRNHPPTKYTTPTKSTKPNSNTNYIHTSIKETHPNNKLLAQNKYISYKLTLILIYKLHNKPRNHTTTNYTILTKSTKLDSNTNNIDTPKQQTTTSKLTTAKQKLEYKLARIIQIEKKKKNYITINTINQETILQQNIKHQQKAPSPVEPPTTSTHQSTKRMQTIKR